jgi:DNA-binding XRE family transcriptional regulator
MKELRHRTGLSQAELAAAIGMSRESIGRMERGSEPVEKRTELAVRYIAEIKPQARSLLEIYEDVLQVLDDACVSGVPSIDRTNRLKVALEDWTEVGGSTEMRPLLYRAQGVIGAINVAPPSGPAWLATMRDLVELKLEWSALRPRAGTS